MRNHVCGNANYYFDQGGVENGLDNALNADFHRRYGGGLCGTPCVNSAICLEYGRSLNKLDYDEFGVYDDCTEWYLAWDPDPRLNGIRNNRNISLHDSNNRESPGYNPLLAPLALEYICGQGNENMIVTILWRVTFGDGKMVCHQQWSLRSVLYRSRRYSGDVRSTNVQCSNRSSSVH